MEKKMLGEPLTLDQLRKMDGQPVLYKRTNQWFIVELEHPDFGECIISGSGYFISLQTAAERGVYTYHTTHINREAWEPCRECKDAEIVDCVESLFMSDSECAAFCFKFCPNCGMPLTTEAWEELEKRVRG